jgi:uncharacterized protein involved in exopolysaccharide biosynthesis
MTNVRGLIDEAPTDRLDPSSSSGVTRAPLGHDPDSSMTRVVALLIRHWRLFVYVPLSCLAVAVVVVLLSDDQYTAKASFIPRATESATSRLASIASQLGIQTGGGEALMNSPAFYRSLLLSDEILQTIAKTELAVSRDRGARSVTLSRFLEVEEPTAARTLFVTTDLLRDLLSVQVDRETGVVQFQVSTASSAVSLQLVTQMLQLVNDFNTRQRRSQAAAEQEFIEERLAASRAQLRAAENRLESFLERNRSFTGDPQLTFVYDRLRREIDLAQATYTTLSQGYEQSSLEALRDTPVITVVQRPIVSPFPEKRKLVTKSLLALFIGAWVALLVAMIQDHFWPRRAELLSARRQAAV